MGFISKLKYFFISIKKDKKLSIYKSVIKKSTDKRILKSVMNAVSYYVENEMIYPLSENAVKEEIKKISQNESKEYKDSVVKYIVDAFEADKVAMQINNWWKNYKNREREIEEEKDIAIRISSKEILFSEEQDMLHKAIRYRDKMCP